MNRFKCVSSCPKVYDDSRSLRIHQLSCTLFKRKQNTRRNVQSFRDDIPTVPIPPPLAPVVESGSQEAVPGELGTLPNFIQGGSRALQGDPQNPDLAHPDPENLEIEYMDPDPAQPYAQSPSPIPEDEPAPEPEPENATRSSGRPARITRRPARYRDEPPVIRPLVPAQRHPESAPAAAQTEQVKRPHFIPFVTQPNCSGVWREYPFGRPSYTPESLLLPEDLLDPHSFPSHQKPEDIPSHLPRPAASTDEPPYAPFGSMTAARLVGWAVSKSNHRSQHGLDELVDIMRQDDFNIEELKGFRAATEMAKLDNYQRPAPSADKPEIHFPPGWITTSVEIPVPATGVNKTEANAPKFEVKNVHIRSLLDIVLSALQEPAAQHFHLFPFRELWQPEGESKPRHIWNELYNSERWIRFHEEACLHAALNGCNLEVVIIGLCIWSDATQLAQFGSSSLWPIYIFLANESKYTRGKPSAFSAHHAGYIPKIDTAEFEAFYFDVFGKKPGPEVTSQVRRELVHEIWLLLLDHRLIRAYVYGVDFDFWDGVKRRFFIRFFTHAMDYPEKILHACIKFLARCPCPICLVTKDDIPKLGLDHHERACNVTNLRKDDHPHRVEVESARRIMFDGLSLKNDRYKMIFHNQSWVPVRNAFSVRFAEYPIGGNYYDMIMPDLLHEVELGVWKALFTHLVRLLVAIGDGKVGELDRRYREITPFGRDTIRRFPKSVSAMHKLAARDFEDMLQCAIPAFDGLFPFQRDNNIVRTLLFEMATWHALAKLRVSDSTLTIELRASTKRLGIALREFNDVTCERYTTVDLPKEAEAKRRRKAAKGGAQGGGAEKGGNENSKDKGKARADIADNEETEEVNKRVFNMNTFKLHSLSHYPYAIEEVGTSENYSTQTGELQHHTVKAILMPRASRKALIPGIGKQHLRARRMFNIQMKIPTQKPRKAASKLPIIDGEPLPPSDPTQHYQMSHEERTENRISLPAWLRQHQNDPATKDFMPSLKKHLLLRFLNKEFDGDDVDFTTAELNRIVILGDAAYTHSTLRINYTSYNDRREQDIINPRTRPFVMMLSPEGGDAHPYWYAQVQAILHLRVAYRNPETFSPEIRSMDVLWIRWLGPTAGYVSGWRAKRLHRVGFVDARDEIDDSPTFGYLDPSVIIRSVHLIPSFRQGKGQNGLGPSIGRMGTDDDLDYLYFEVNMFADRDMFMRYRGNGLGHHSTREATKILVQDRDSVDQSMYAKHANTFETHALNKQQVRVYRTKPSEPVPEPEPVPAPVNAGDKPLDDSEGEDSDASDANLSGREEEEQESSEDEDDDPLGILHSRFAAL